MSYKVHKFNLGKEIDPISLQDFLNGLEGDVVSIVPNIIPKFHLMGATAGYDSLIIVEKKLR